MSTRSRIAILESDGSVKSIYCHWDGYLSNNGNILLKNYTDPVKVEGLINLGDISSLGETLENTNAYHRDNGEDLVITKSKNFDEFINKIDYLFEEYVYLFKDGKWFYIESYKFYKNKKNAGPDDFIELTQEEIVKSEIH